MFRIDEDSGSITYTLSSEMRMTDSVIQESHAYLRQYGISEFSSFKLVLRELLNNAIEHGNYNMTERTVKCRIEHIGGKRFRITVEDEGQGFEYDNLILTLPEDPRQIRNRGFALINAFADQIEFNDKGNRVTVYMTYVEETTFNVVDENGRQVIVPSGDLTAATAEKFRVNLIRMLDKGHTHYRFDFKHVEDIDSVSLSVLIIFAKTLSTSSKITDNKKKKKLEVVNMNKDLVDLFHMTRMDRLYNIIQ